MRQLHIGGGDCRHALHVEFALITVTPSKGGVFFDLACRARCLAAWPHAWQPVGAKMTIYDGYYKNQYYYGAHLNWLDTLVARDPSGRGNNLTHDDWGSAHQAFVRATPNSYPGDGLGPEWELPLQNLGTQGIPPNLEHFLSCVNRGGFPKAGSSDSRCVLGEGGQHAWRDTCPRICGFG
jgi:hypothetical protein